jgi:hypothetical protein
MNLWEQMATARGRLMAVAVALYAVLLGLGTWTHTFWRDEAGAWLIGRDLGLTSMWHVVHYEGHPPLWFLMMYAVAHVTWNPEWMKLPNLVATALSAWMILSARELSAWTRLGLVFSYFMLFEYGLIDRNYMIGIVFLIAAVRWMQEDDAELKIGVALSLAALASFAALIVAVCLYAYFLLPGMRRDGEVRSQWDSRRFIAMGIFSVCAAGSAAVIWPPEDSAAFIFQGHPAAWTRIGNAFSGIADAYLPVPGRLVGFWNVTVFDWMPGYVGIVVGALLAVGLAVLFRNGRVRWFFLGTSALLLAQMSATSRMFMRHIGWLFVVFLLALLLEGDGGLRKTWRAWMLSGVLLVQAGTGIYTAMVSVIYPFSAALQVADYLREHHLDQGPMVFAPGAGGLAVLAYLERPSAFYPELHGPGSYVVWSRATLWAEHLPSEAELAALTSNGQPTILLTIDPLDAGDMKRLKVDLLESFPGAITSGFPYYLYQRRPAQAMMAGER